MSLAAHPGLAGPHRRKPIDGRPSPAYNHLLIPS
jgi:hypothetical protein